MYQHKKGLFEGFSKRYNIRRLVYFEVCTDIRIALQREKQIKGWSRAKRIKLILSANPSWHDLATGWFKGS
jgi:putative endonuclease